ncbi:MAG: hypothetical protein LKF00_08970 [Olsenella sp.]|nr:hypothetical protein [Olsenella sp.]
MQLDKADSASARKAPGQRFAQVMNNLAVVLGAIVVALLAFASLVTSYRVGNTACGARAKLPDGCARLGRVRGRGCRADRICGAQARQCQG